MCFVAFSGLTIEYKELSAVSELFIKGVIVRGQVKNCQSKVSRTSSRITTNRGNSVNVNIAILIVFCANHILFFLFECDHTTVAFKKIKKNLKVRFLTFSHS